VKKIIERIFIKILKYLKTDLLTHAHVQIGVGHNTYNSGEGHVVDTILSKVLKKEPKVIFDVGANVGDYAILLAKRFKSSKIYCFEPIPANYKKLVNNTLSLTTINVQTAFGSSRGTFELYIGDHNMDGSMATAYKKALDNVFQFAGETNSVTECQVTTIDDFCAGKIDQIDFLKIDVEGHELEVLKGASAMINSGKIQIIQFEFNEFNIFSKSFMWEFYDTLKQYDFYRIMPQDKLCPMGGYNSMLEIFRYQNILAIKKSLNYCND